MNTDGMYMSIKPGMNECLPTPTGNLVGADDRMLRAKSRLPRMDNGAEFAQVMDYAGEAPAYTMVSSEDMRQGFKKL